MGGMQSFLQTHISSDYQIMCGRRRRRTNVDLHKTGFFTVKFSWDLFELAVAHQVETLISCSRDPGN
jgi:hypothetical protein